MQSLWYTAYGTPCVAGKEIYHQDQAETKWRPFCRRHFHWRKSIWKSLQLTSARFFLECCVCAFFSLDLMGNPRGQNHSSREISGAHCIKLCYNVKHTTNRKNPVQSLWYTAYGTPCVAGKEIYHQDQAETKWRPFCRRHFHWRKSIRKSLQQTGARFFLECWVSPFFSIDLMGNTRGQNHSTEFSSINNFEFRW